MIHLVYSNRTEELLDAFVGHLRATAAERHPLDPVEVVVPNRNMEAYLRFGVAEALGIAANLRFRRLERWVEEVVAATTPGVELVDKDLLQGAALAVLLDEEGLAAPELAPVAAYLELADDPAARELRLARLGSHLGRLFEEYLFSRPEMLAAWDRRDRWLPGAEHESWQAAIWRRARALLHARSAVTLGEWLERLDPASLPRRPVHVFGVSYVARVFQRFLAAAAAGSPLHVYTLNPCREFWEDVETIYEHRRRSRREGGSAAEERDPFRLLEASGPLPLRLWGRPGRENIRLLNELSDCDFDDRFRPPPRPETLLGRLQSDILDLAEPAGPGTSRADGSLEIVAAPSPRREAETVAEDIWRRLRREDAADDEEPLRFHEIAVIVNPAAQAAYLPHLTAAFDEVWQIPHSVSDLPLAAASRAAEGARLVLELARGPITRASLLRVMTHPAVLGAAPGTGPERWAGLAEALGIRFGADAEELVGTYLAEDRVSWSQGLRRAALAAFLPVAEGEDDPLWRDPHGREELVPRLPGDGLESVGRFALLARHLLADLRAIAGGRRTLAAWAQAFRELWKAILDPGEDDDLLPVLGAMRSLERADVDGVEVPGPVATELALEALAGLSGSRGRYLAEGVVVSSFLPMRAIPFRVVYVLGLGEGLFPAATRRDELDLRSGHRRAGDVEPSERDKYMFLETLLSARERLVLTYPSRDETSGEERQPSGVILQLLRVLREGYLEEAEAKEVVVTRPALRREEAARPNEGDRQEEANGPDANTLLPGAAAEAAAARAGAPVRRLWQGEPPARILRRLREALEPGARRELAAALGLAEMPTAAGSAVRTLSIGDLRGFFECPLQASAKVLLRLQRDDDEAPEEVEEEELASSRPERAVLLRAALERALRRGEPPSAAYAHLAARRRLDGRGPLGVLADCEAAADGELLDLWWKALETNGALGGVEVLRFGPAPETDRADRALPEVPLAIAGATEVGLGGATQLLAGSERATLVFDANGDGKPPRLFRYALRGWVDHLLLAAAGLVADRPRKLLVLGKKGATPIRLDPCTQQNARQTLASLAGELLSRPHPYLLPGDLVLEACATKDAVDFGGEFASKLDELLAAAALDPDKAGASRWGPITDLSPYPPATDAATLARLRFEPVLRMMTVIS